MTEPTKDFTACPKCGKKMTAQWDTQGEEPYQRCDKCWLSFTLERQPTICDTAIPDERLEG